MRPAALAEVHVDTERRRACERLAGRTTELGRFDLVLDERVRIARWAPGVAALRLTGRWQEGRGRGDVTVDLVATGPERTIVSFQLQQPDERLTGRVTDDDVWSVATRLREVLEHAARPATAVAPISELPVARSGILPA